MPYKDPAKEKQSSKERTVRYKNKHRERLRPIRNKRNLVDNRRIKRIVFAEYGNKCACCLEETAAFLTLDHINNDGKNVSGARLYRQVRREGFPKDRYRLLCWNCNCGRASMPDKRCPHLDIIANNSGLSAGLLF